MTDTTQETIPPYERLKVLVDPDAYKPGFLRRAMNTSAALKTVADGLSLVGWVSAVLAGPTDSLAILALLAPLASTVTGTISMGFCAARKDELGSVRADESILLQSCRAEFSTAAKSYMTRQSVSIGLMAASSALLIAWYGEGWGGASSLTLAALASTAFASAFAGSVGGWVASSLPEKLNVYEAAIKTVEWKQKSQPPSATVNPAQPV